MRAIVFIGESSELLRNKSKVSLYRSLTGQLGVSSLAADTKLLICARTSGCTTSSLPVEGSMVEICGIEPQATAVTKIRTLQDWMWWC